MRFLLLFAFLPLLLAAVEIKVDHVTVAGSSLARLRAALAAVGIPSEYGGPHANGATEMALASFADGSYLELIAIKENADAKAVDANSWAAFLRTGGEPCAWAASVADVGAEAARLRQAGVRVADPVRSGRVRPDGVRLEWETATVGERQGAFFPFLIHDFTPRKDRAFPTGKPTNRDFGGISHVVIAVADLNEAIKRYRQAYGLPAPLKQVDKEFNAHLATLGGGPVILAAPLTADSWLNSRLEKFGEAPVAFLLSTRRGKYKAATKTRWFGVDVSWFDVEKLGWRLGFE
jgi:catechol 2,3-dioxygenase-like lactoylglutathione lyase family enzyme